MSVCCGKEHSTEGLALSCTGLCDLEQVSGSFSATFLIHKTGKLKLALLGRRKQPALVILKHNVEKAKV